MLPTYQLLYSLMQWCMQLPSSLHLPIMHTCVHKSLFRDATRLNVRQGQAVASASFCTVGNHLCRVTSLGARTPIPSCSNLTQLLPHISNMLRQIRRQVTSVDHDYPHRSQQQQPLSSMYLHGAGPCGAQGSGPVAQPLSP